MKVIDFKKYSEWAGLDSAIILENVLKICENVGYNYDKDTKSYRVVKEIQSKIEENFGVRFE